jgi:hypothetical protein
MPRVNLLHPHCRRRARGADRRMLPRRLHHFSSVSHRCRHVLRSFASVTTAHGKEEHHQEVNEPTGHLFNRVVWRLEIIMSKPLRIIISQVFRRNPIRLGTSSSLGILGGCVPLDSCTTTSQTQGSRLFVGDVLKSLVRRLLLEMRP